MSGLQAPPGWHPQPDGGYRWWTGTEWAHAFPGTPVAPLRFLAPWSVEETQLALSQHLGAEGAQVSAYVPGFVSGAVTGSASPNAVAAVLLLLAFLVPGIIYLVVASRPRPYAFSVRLSAGEGGTTIATAGAPKALEAVNRVASALGRPLGT